ncbi:GDSL esterase/lipase At1g29660-like isoform X2 [Punica granatum]|uniref:GDSL esterase/lipase At1g29660-like isoform X2 n=1 Tax=Punica granatum TaxID=22663 RepID=A0A6P8CHZ9_PUNGR|nr:GDSL esterase/lipase At1g29660-like isoform X2 [Punica granatum]
MAFDDALRIILSFFLFTKYLQNSVQGEPQVPCYFIFGDSFADSGNNNNLDVDLRANYSPYGVDFPKGPTGRYTNGRTVADIIGKDILKGVNYASGGSGIRDETGKELGDVVSLNEQLGNHFTVLSKISAILNSESASRDYLQKCIYIVIIGTNDYLNNYFSYQNKNDYFGPSFYQTSTMYTPQQYANVLVKQYSKQLKRLRSYGARKVAIFGVGLIGQLPTIVRTFGNNSSMIDAAAQLFSRKLLPLVTSLNKKFTNAKFTYINTTGIVTTSAPLLAHLNTKDSCCKLRSDGSCIEGSTPCLLRTHYAFFDGFHPTEAVNVASAGKAYNKLSPLHASPYDICQLAQLP